MTLNFHPLSLSDASMVRKYVQHSRRRNCDLSFANLYAWQPLFQTEICEWGNFLLFRFYADGHLAYLMPLGNGSLPDVLNQLLDDAARLNQPLLILGVCEDSLPDVRRVLGDARINPNRDYADYVYLRQSLASLAGKKLQAKRNHVHHFKNAYPDCRYEPLSDSLVPACLDLSLRWRHACVERARQRSVHAEAEAIRRALTHRRELGLSGGALLVGEQVVAFTYGAPINDDTFDICVEKADESFEGAYAVINQEFVARLPEQFEYVNREEDMGIDGLRKAKLSYHPAMLLTKYSVYTAQMLKPKFSSAGLSERNFLVKTQVRALWKLCFDDSEPFLDLYFNHIYRPDLNICIEENGRVVSALQRLPYQMIYGDAVPAAYVSGVCTLPERRGCGLASELMRQAHRQMYADGKLFSALIPDDNDIKPFYKRLGYYSLETQRWHGAVVMPNPCNNPAFSVYLHLPDGRLNEWQAYLDARLRRVEGAFLYNVENLRTALDDVFLSKGCVVEARAEGHCCGLLIAVPFLEPLMMILEWFADSKDVANSLKSAALETLDAQNNIIQRNCVMLRVINVLEALRAFARRRPDAAMLLRVSGDEHIPENNGLYALRNGLCNKFPEHAALPAGLPEPCREISVAQLPALLFPDGGPYLSLMDN